jgi:translation initiation factor IF-1
MKEGTVEMNGTVVGVNRSAATNELANGSVIRGVISGRLMQNRIRILAGAEVREVALHRNSLSVTGELNIYHFDAHAVWHQGYAPIRLRPSQIRAQLFWQLRSVRRF